MLNRGMRAGEADFTIDVLASALRAGDRAALARAITLIESRRPDHQALARSLLAILNPYAGQATRVGLTGAPGVGKSTFIDTLGSNLTATGRRVAVLAVDPAAGGGGGPCL